MTAPRRRACKCEANLCARRAAALRLAQGPGFPPLGRELAEPARRQAWIGIRVEARRRAPALPFAPKDPAGEGTRPPAEAASHGRLSSIVQPPSSACPASRLAPNRAGNVLLGFRNCLRSPLREQRDGFRRSDPEVPVLTDRATPIRLTSHPGITLRARFGSLDRSRPSENSALGIWHSAFTSGISSGRET